MLWYSSEAPRRGASGVYYNKCFREEKKNSSTFRLFRLNELSRHYILEESNFNFRLCVLDIPREKWLNFFANSGDSDQMPISAASDQGLHCLPITLFLSGIWRRCLNVAWCSLLTFRVLPHWKVPPQTHDMIFLIVTLYWHRADQLWFYFLNAEGQAKYQIVPF